MISTGRLQLRPAEQSDLAFLVRLRNDPESVRFSRRGVLDVVRIRSEFLDSPRAHSRICLGEEEALGYARFDFESPAARARWPEISVALAPEQRGQGLGRNLVASATRWAFENWDPSKVEGVVAFIHQENAASRRCFEAAGYVRGDPADAGLERWEIERR